MHDADVVLGLEIRVAADAEADDAVRVRLVGEDADDECRAAGEHADRRPDRCGLAFVGLCLREGVDRLGLPPGGFVEEAVDADRRWRLSRAQARSLILCERRDRQKKKPGSECRRAQPPCYAQAISMQ